MRALGLRDIELWPVSSRPLGEARDIYDGGGQFISLLGSNPLFHHPEDRWPHSVEMSKLEKLNGFMINMISDLANQDWRISYGDFIPDVSCNYSLRDFVYAPSGD